MEWEGTVSVVWAQVEGEMKVEKMEVVVHTFKTIGFGMDEKDGWEWGLPDSVADVLKVSLAISVGVSV